MNAGGPVGGIKSFILQDLPAYFGHMRLSIVLHRPKESVSDCLVGNIPISGLLEIILWGCDSARPVPPCTKEQIRSC